MLLNPFLTGSLEYALNSLFSYNRSTKSVAKCLSGKVLQIDIEELDSPLVLLFNNRGANVLSKYSDQSDCTVRSRVVGLLQLLDHKKLPLLAHRGELIVEGDIQLIQSFMVLLDLVEWDLAEGLAPYIGDIAAQHIIETLEKKAHLLKDKIEHCQYEIAETLIEEWRVAQGESQIAWLKESVNAVTRRTQALIVRMNQLEAMR